MRNIKVTFRAVFEQPIGVLNPSGWAVPGQQSVEVFGGGERWNARCLENGNTFTRLGTHIGPEGAKTAALAAFARQVSPWQMWGTPPNEKEERQLLLHEVHFVGNKVEWKEPDDYTHLIDPNGQGRVPPAVCGARVKVSSFISAAANLTPTCKACAESYRKGYPAK